MTRIRRGGYVFVAWKGDHDPRHVHVSRDDVEIVKWDLEHHKALTGRASPRLVEIIKRLQEEGRL